MTHKFYYMSDLHIEFASPRFMGISGDNLILAGDISLLKCLNPRMTDAQNRKLRDRTLTFFDIVRENFQRVFYVTGNHESYGFDINLEAEYIEKYLPGVIHLNDSSYHLDDSTVVLGGTLWTDMNKNNPLAHRVVGAGMNDFRYIEMGKDRFYTKHAYEKHTKTMEFLTTELEANKHKNCVVVTHHSPTYRGVNPYHGGNHLDAGYASALDEFIMDRTQVKYWVFGHTHIQSKFEIGETTLVSNARGYEGYESTATSFNPDTYFEV